MIEWIAYRALEGCLGAVFGGPPFWAVWQICDRTRDRMTRNREDVSR